MIAQNGETSGAGGSAEECAVAKICEEMIEEENKGAAAGCYFEDLLADCLCFRRATGEVAGKVGFICALEPNAQESERSLDGSVQVHIYGEVAVASLRVSVTPKSGDGSRKLFRNVRIFQRASPGGNWKVQMWFNAAIPPAA